MSDPSCPHGQPGGEARCFLCFVGCPPDWTPETCEHPSVEIGPSEARCDACGRRAFLAGGGPPRSPEDWATVMRFDTPEEIRAAAASWRELRGGAT